MNKTTTHFKVVRGQEHQAVKVEQVGRSSFTVQVGEDTVVLDVERVSSREYHALCEGLSCNFMVRGSLPALALHGDGRELPVELLDERQEARIAAVGAGQGQSADGSAFVLAPMPGKVVKCLAKEGDVVCSGQGVLVVEAMKMENELCAPFDGQVCQMRVAEGDNVDAGECLVVIQSSAQTS